MRSRNPPPPTFAELGTRFRLFEAPVSEASDFAGAGTCSVCDKPSRACFELGIGAEVLQTCAGCGGLVAADAQEERTPCPHCARANRPAAPARGRRVCAECLQLGRAAFTHDTELGMVRWVDAQAGLTHGLPIDEEHREGIFFGEPDSEGWRRAQIPAEALIELTRTPCYLTIQGERWLMHCQKPMIYLGPWSPRLFSAAAPDGDGKGLFMRIVAEASEDAWAGVSSKAYGSYMFRCQQCAAHRGHWDLD